MYDLLIFNVVGFFIIYLLWCFYDWNIVTIKNPKKWKPVDRLMFLVVFIIISLMSLLPWHTLGLN